MNKTVLYPYQRRWANDPARRAIAVKGSQEGYSTATAAWAVDRCIEFDRRTITFLSRSDRQSLELGEKAKAWVDGYKGVIAEYHPNIPVRFGDTVELTHRIDFPNLSRIICLPANPDTARGYTGDIVLDEFAFHEDSAAIFRAAYRQTTLGYDMRVLSTPNGQEGKYYELAKLLGLDTGIRPRRQPVVAHGWSGHWCDIYLAVQEGLPVDPADIKEGLEGDEETWQQEYLCQFISQASQWIPPGLYLDNAAAEATVELPERIEKNLLYAGWDIARSRDLSVIWCLERLGDVTWTRGIVEMRNIPTPDQVSRARVLMPFVRKMNIDKGVMGLSMYETLDREFPGKVEGVQFGAPIKEQLAVLQKRRMEEHKCRLPDYETARRSFQSLKKTTNSIGQARFDTEHDAKFGHADHFWASALAEAAAELPTARFSEDAYIGGEPVCAGFGAGVAPGFSNADLDRVF